jgi:ABC-type proline/glycine betaine transport system permease subunit
MSEDCYFGWLVLSAVFGSSVGIRTNDLGWGMLAGVSLMVLAVVGDRILRETRRKKR